MPFPMNDPSMAYAHPMGETASRSSKAAPMPDADPYNHMVKWYPDAGEERKLSPGKGQAVVKHPVGTLPASPMTQAADRDKLHFAMRLFFRSQRPQNLVARGSWDAWYQALSLAMDAQAGEVILNLPLSFSSGFVYTSYLGQRSRELSVGHAEHM